MENRHQSHVYATHEKSSDNGTGIPDAVVAKIFQPFFTTKPTGEGTGLGLSLSYDIVTKGHGGTLTVDSVEGKGTEFIITFPSVSHLLVMTRFYTLLFILVLTASLSQAQSVFRIDSLPTQGVLLDKGWTFHAGDNPDFAKPEFDDKSWKPLNPSLDIFELSQVPKTGKIGWLRLHLTFDSTVLQNQLALIIQQSIASEYYLNGKLIQRFGKISQNSNKIVAFDPLWKPVSFPVSRAQHQVLAIRFALKPAIHYTTIFETSNPVATIQLLKSEEAVNIYTNLRAYTERFTMIQLGVWVMLFMLNFIFFLSNRNNKSRLYFAIFALFFLVGDVIQLNLYILENDVSNKFYAGNLVFVFYVFAEFSLMAAIYAVFERKRDLVFWLVAGYIIPALLLDSLVYGWGWQFGGPMLEIFVHLNVIRIAIIAILEKKRNAYIIASGAIASLFFFVLFLRMGTFYNQLFLLALTNLRIAYYFLFIYCIPISAFIYLGLDFAYINKELKKKLEENETLAAEKQQILATQNEVLEVQVAERTAELEHKNRDLEIEAALDKVRSRSLAMHSSDELQEVVYTVIENLNELGLNIASANIILFTECSRDIVLWTKTNTEDAYSKAFQWPYNDQPEVADFFKATENRQPLYTKSFTFEEKNKFWRNLFERSDFKHVPDFRKKFILEADYFSFSLACQKNTGVLLTKYASKLFSVKENEILQRFATAFEQTYTRFLDLQKAEEQARQAQIEVALERVRSRTMAMQHSEELKEAANLLFQQVQTLGIPAWSCGYNIWETDDEFCSGYMSTNGSLQPPFKFPLTQNPTFIHFKESRQKGESFYWEAVADTALAAHYAYMRNLPDFGEILHGFLKAGYVLPTFQINHVANFSHGNLIFITSQPVPESHEVFQRFATVFDQTYTRFLDLQKAEAQAEQARLDLILIQTEKKRAEDALSELRITQAQLIQKEKLASLGELTAGIAHEIQNPLNFVNNFSEVSVELVTELEEEQQKPTRDTELETELLGDLKQNLQKITHHGGRASAIVKGMLEHSRSSTGERQPTDLNALADEYLRLAYQGLRAKDKNFNCELITDFAPDLGLVEVVPQEIGRVLLNLFNNAFYAVSEKQKTATTDYRLTVWVSTRLDGTLSGGTTLTGPPGGRATTAEMLVRDNGMGIPDAVKAKIFQPFFTTKPTGEGTGLGLSLSYDIVTKRHGGTLEVESEEGQGTTFIVKLPIA